MAVEMFKAPAQQQGQETDAHSDFKKRVELARRDKNRHISRIEDCYKYGMPWRHKVNQSEPQDQLDEIFDEELMTVLEDFSSDMLNTFTPQKDEWVEPKPTKTLDSGQQNQIAQALSDYKRVVFAEMARSNLYQALQEAYLDLGPGTMCLIIDDLDASEPIHCQAIAANDCLLLKGPYGQIGLRGRERKVVAEDIPTLWPDAKKQNGEQWQPGDMTELDVVDAVLRDWNDKSDEVWTYYVMVGGDVALEKKHTGKGSCPFIVGRWSRDPTTAWGFGPTYKTLPAIKTLNHFRYTSLKNYDKEVDPVVSYEDDGVVNTEHGINSGDWVPRAVGSQAPEVLESKSRMDVAIFNIDEVRASIRRAHYQDRPEQKGKTPPTAQQWMDERAETARRMGTPGTNLVIEWQYPIFRRFAYLLAQRGVLPKVELNGEAIALEPVSPLLRAQEQEEVIRLDRFVELLAARFGPEIVNVLVDQFGYSARLAEKLGVDPELVRTEDDIGQIMEQIGPLLTGTPLGGEDTARGP